MSPLWWSASLGKLEKHTTYDIALYLLSLLIKGASCTDFDLTAGWFHCLHQNKSLKKCINYIYYLCKGNVTRYQMPEKSHIFPKLSTSCAVPDTPLRYGFLNVQLCVSVMGNFSYKTFLPTSVVIAIYEDGRSWVNWLTCWFCSFIRIGDGCHISHSM